MPRISKSVAFVIALASLAPQIRAGTYTPREIPHHTPRTTLDSSLIPDFRACGGTGAYRNGSFSITATPDNLSALKKMISLANLRKNIAAINIANIDNVGDGASDPYLRLLVSIDSVGHIGVSQDPAAITLKYQPGHPHADTAGIVKAPAITLEQEAADLQFAGTEFKFATAALQALQR